MSLVIEGRAIGPGAPCFVIAEAGVNHNGDLEMAHRLVDAAAAAGVDAVKFQTFDPDALASAEAPKASYQARLTDAAEGQRDMLRRLTLSKDGHVELKRHAEERRLLFLSTPFEPGSADFLERLGVPAFKVPSGEVTNHPFLVHLARKGLPLLVSTGMSEMAEVEAAVAAIAATPAHPPIALLHCTSSYPAPVESVNLRAMETLRARFGVPVGYSDHTLGAAIALAAVALGANLVEKHITLDCGLPGPDHAASMEPGPFAELVAGIRAIHAGLGDGRKTVQPCERETQRVARKSLFAARDLTRGERLVEADLASRRPGTGLSPARLTSLIGRPLARNVAAGAMLQEGDLE